LSYSNGTNTSYAYDNASRLTGITHAGSSGIIEALTYQYDAAGNRVSLTRNNGTASLLPSALSSANYDAANAQISFAGTTLTYDNNGNLISDGINAYVWDARNRLITISGGANGSFRYDVLGRRSESNVNSVTLQYLYDGLDVGAEIQGGSVGVNYLNGLGIDEPFVRQTSSGNEFYSADALGSTLALTGGGGTTVTSYSYDPFGGTVVTGNSSNRFQFTGREDEGGGLYYYRARYYRPLNARFLNEDLLYSPLLNVSKCRGNYAPTPSRFIEFDRSVSILLRLRFNEVASSAFALNTQKNNLYSYTENNPVNKFDSLGLVSGPQDITCTSPAVNLTACTTQCCIAHDVCYYAVKGFCSASSWIDPLARWTRPDCLSCNRAVIQCAVRNLLGGNNSRKSTCDLSDFRGFGPGFE